MRMVVAIKASHNPAGITRTHEVTSPFLTSVEMNAGRRSPRHLASHTTRMGYEITRQRRSPADPTHLQAPYLVSIL